MSDDTGAIYLHCQFALLRVAKNCVETILIFQKKSQYDVVRLSRV
jgi:hypothetical protein